MVKILWATRPGLGKKITGFFDLHGTLELGGPAGRTALLPYNLNRQQSDLEALIT